MHGHIGNAASFGRSYIEMFSPLINRRMLLLSAPSTREPPRARVRAR
jgi:hypothetical protein